MSYDKLSAKATIRVGRPPAEVFFAFADAGAMSKFWFTRRDGGLKAGESCTWFIGDGEDAFAFDVRVKEINRPHRIVIEWENGEALTQVVWSIEGDDKGDTILIIEESGFAGSEAAIVARALDSTGGFNQVIVAAKAFIEHGIELNVVADHA